MGIKFNNHNVIDKSSTKRLSEIGGQEIINLFDGGRLGIVADVDLLINDNTGSIEALLIPDSKSFLSFFSDKKYIEVPWESIRKIGQDTLIVELDENNNNNRKRMGY
jgi:YlmC/YmxH family sporulation protein